MRCKKDNGWCGKMDWPREESILLAKVLQKVDRVVMLRYDNEDKEKLERIKGNMKADSAI